jgi:transcriptional regulator with XRE-family HTH domain
MSSFSFELLSHIDRYVTKKGISRKEFAELANISTKTIKKIYSFKENIKLSSILKILSVTGGKITLYPKTDEEVNE